VRWVVKVGSAVISKPEGGLDRSAIGRIGSQLSRLHQRNNEVILVSSGAVAAGMGRLRLVGKPSDLRLKQSAAAVGQLALMKAYEEVFSQFNIVPSQILLTRDDLLNRQRYLNIRNTLMNLLDLKTLPIINENDSVSTEEIQFGDNDTLSAVVATKVEADRLVLLSNVSGLYESVEEKNQGGKFIPVVEKIDRKLEKIASRDVGSVLSVGGMSAKLEAAKMATAAGIETWIANGHEEGILEKIEKGETSAGTKFIPRKVKFASRHAWIAFGRKTKGSLMIDEGALKALVDNRKSLLAKGVKSVKGSFSVGDTLQIKSLKGTEIGRGLVNYDSREVLQIQGHHSSEISGLLGRSISAEIIHRDNLVLL